MAHLAEQYRRALCVGQDATAQLSGVRETVIEELAYGLEHRGVTVEEMHARVRATATALQLEPLLEQPPSVLSGGQLRRVALAQVAVLRPEMMLLDDPLMGLDARARDDVLALCQALAADGVAVVMSCDRPVVDGPIILVDADGARAVSDTELADHLDPQLPAVVAPQPPQEYCYRQIHVDRGTPQRRRWWQGRRTEAAGFAFGPVDLTARRGEVLWLTGPNGVGKTSLMRALVGLDQTPPPQHRTAVVLQRSADQIVTPTVAQQVGDAQLVELLGIDPETHPLDLSAGQLRLVAVAEACARRASVLVLDEPNVGLFAAERELFHVLLAEAVAHSGVVMSCHDEAFMEEIARYVPVRSCALEELVTAG